jgi:hypothetical protein
MDPDTGDYGRLPSDFSVNANLPTREALARLGLDSARWLALDPTEKIFVAARLFPGMAYVDRPLNPIALTILYLDRYATAMVSPAGRVKLPRLRMTPR